MTVTITMNACPGSSLYAEAPNRVMDDASGCTDRFDCTQDPAAEEGMHQNVQNHASLAHLSVHQHVLNPCWTTHHKALNQPSSPTAHEDKATCPSQRRPCSLLELLVHVSINATLYQATIRRSLWQSHRHRRIRSFNNGSAQP